eukprot:295790-Pelagomonas_calceolata.AAC.1
MMFPIHKRPTTPYKCLHGQMSEGGNLPGGMECPFKGQGRDRRREGRDGLLRFYLVKQASVPDAKERPSCQRILHRQVYAGHRPRALRRGPLTSKLARASPDVKTYLHNELIEPEPVGRSCCAFCQLRDGHNGIPGSPGE